VHEGVVELIDDGVVHRPAELRVRVQNDGDRRVLLARRVIAALDASCGTGEDDFRHSIVLEPAWLPRTARQGWRRARLEKGNPAPCLELF
jgi:Mg-chelatase subunit ChlI